MLSELHKLSKLVLQKKKCCDYKSWLVMAHVITVFKKIISKIYFSSLKSFFFLKPLLALLILEGFCATYGSSNTHLIECNLRRFHIKDSIQQSYSDKECIIEILQFLKYKLMALRVHQIPSAVLRHYRLKK